MKKVVLSIIVIIFITSCNDNSSTIQDFFNDKYLPADSAIIFSSGNISSGLIDRDITISPDYKELFYCILEEPHFTIVQVKKDKDGNWLKPRIAPFSGRFNDCEPMFSPDGSRLYFCSNRPLDNNGLEKDYDIWYVKRTKNGWSDPVNIGEPVNTMQNEFYPSLTLDNTIYFTSASMKIMRSKFENDHYLEPELLSDSINTKIGEYNAVIAHDESFLIYTSHGWPDDMGQGDLYISYRKSDETWTKAKNLGSGINSPFTEMSPSISPDGNYLFFASNRKLGVNDNSPNKTMDDIQSKASHFDNGKFNIFWVSTNALSNIEKRDPMQ